MNERLKKTIAYGALALGIFFGLRACNSSERVRFARVNKIYAKLEEPSRVQFVNKNIGSLEKIISSNPELSLRVTKSTLESNTLSQENYKAIGDAVVSKLENQAGFLAYETKKQPIDKQKAVVINVINSMDKEAIDEINQYIDQKLENKVEEYSSRNIQNFKKENTRNSFYEKAKKTISNAWESVTGFIFGY